MVETLEILVSDKKVSLHKRVAKELSDSRVLNVNQESHNWELTPMAGYSGTPLVKKLGFKEGFRAALVNSPKNFQNELGPLPANVKLLGEPLPKKLDLVILFVESQQQLNKGLSKLKQKLAESGMLWIAWPKKASGVATDLSDSSVRHIGLEAGLVDVKVCAINEVWSGLKFVYRLKDRKAR